MKIYLVGGAVRDELMGLEPKDLDYVVVGATPEEMLNVGYKQVGADFPVFLHPETGDEYALARTEVKNGTGYQGFDIAFGPEVTLEEDLGRRDLTINAIAKDLETGEIIDPYNGLGDIESRVLHPTTEAFKDDPVRVLRAARFLARYPMFKPSVDLVETSLKMLKSGELDNLVPERVWLETQKALSEPKPSRYFRALLGYGIFPELDCMIDVEENNRWHPEASVFHHVMMATDYAARYGDPIVTFGALCHDLGKPKAYEATNGLKSTRHEQLGISIADALCDRLKIPNDYRYMATKASELHTHVHLSFDMKPKTIHKFFKKFKSKKWFKRLLLVANSDKKGRGKPACDWIYTQPNYMQRCWNAMESTDTKSISDRMKPGPAVGEAIRRAEISSIASVDKKPYQKPYDDCHAEYFKSLENI